MDTRDVALQMDTSSLISKLSEILATILVTKATDERPFCALKYLEIFLLTSTGI